MESVAATEQGAENIVAEPQECIIAAFYKFADFPKYKKVQLNLKSFMQKRDVKGTILLTPEGLNGTISGSREGVDATLDYLKELKGFEDMEHKEATHHCHVFERTKVKCKNETIGIGEYCNPMEMVGEYVDSKDWNKLIERGVPMIDTRNDYEAHLGKFKNAIDPQTKRFKDLRKWTEENLDPAKDKEVAMYCTGGIRCEKYSSYLLSKGFEKVYHLKGGILQYLEDTPEEQSTWEGECYVFDERVAVKHGLEVSEDAENCPACGHALMTKDRVKDSYIPGVQCPFCADKH